MGTTPYPATGGWLGADCPSQPEAFNMVSVIAIDVGVQRAGVDDQCDELTSLIRISSIQAPDWI